MALIPVEQKLIIINQLLIARHLILKRHKLILASPNAVLKLVLKIIHAVGALAQMGKTPTAPVLPVLISIQPALLAHLPTEPILMAYALVVLLVMEFAHTENVSMDLKLILDVIIQQIATLRLKGVYI